MSKTIVIIESDASFAQKLRGGLEEKGFSVKETPDGKVAVDLVRKEKPDLVVLSVELAAGQSGYIVCGKLKKDDDLKKIPIIIIGKDAEGFEAHKRLKARAEDYLKKPFDPPAIVDKIKDLIGLPAQETEDLVLDEDESLGLSSLGEDEPLVEEQPAAEIVEDDDGTRGGDPDLDMLDAAFDDLSDPLAEADAGGELPVEAPPDEGLVEEPPALEGEPLGAPEGDADAALDALQFDDALEKGPAEDEIALDALEPMDEPIDEPAPKPVVKPAPRRPTPVPSPVVMAADHAELQSLRDRVAELESRERELTDENNSKTNELDALRSTTGGKDKEYFSLKEQNTKKDKEIVRLKQDLNEKEQEVIELKEKENQLEQQASELTTEAAKREAQIKTLSQRAEAYAGERKKFDTAHNATKDELRQLSAKLATAQGELDQAQDAMADLQRELDSARQIADAARGEGDAAKAELEQARAELDGAKGELEEARTELDGVKAELEGAKTELDGAKSELEQLKADQQSVQEESERLKAEADRVPALEEESTGLRARIAEFEENAAKNEERVVKAYQKIKSDEKMREKTKKALAVAVQLLEESAAAPDDDARGGGDEVSAA